MKRGKATASIKFDVAKATQTRQRTHKGHRRRCARVKVQRRVNLPLRA